MPIIAAFITLLLTVAFSLTFLQSIAVALVVAVICGSIA